MDNSAVSGKVKPVDSSLLLKTAHKFSQQLNKIKTFVKNLWAVLSSSEVANKIKGGSVAELLAC